MPTITFTVTTTAPAREVIVYGSDSSQTPIALHGGAGTHDFPTGFVGNAVLTLTGTKGTTAKFKVAQGQTVLGERNHIKITSETGRSQSTIPFLVQ